MKTYWPAWRKASLEAKLRTWETSKCPTPSHRARTVLHPQSSSQGLIPRWVRVTIIHIVKLTSWMYWGQPSWPRPLIQIYGSIPKPAISRQNGRMVTVFPKPEPQACDEILEPAHCPQLSLRAGLLTVGLIWKPHWGITWEIVSMLDTCLWLPCWNPETKISFIAFLKRELFWGGKKRNRFWFFKCQVEQIGGCSRCPGTQFYFHTPLPTSTSSCVFGPSWD